MAELGFERLPLDRYTRKVTSTPVEGRQSELYHSGDADDECHFLFICSIYDNIRRVWEKM